MKSFDFVELARKIISFDTTPQSSTVELVQFLFKLATEMDLYAEIQSENQNGIPQSNIIIGLKKPEPGQQSFLLQAHLDTTDPGSYSLWKKNQNNPFEATIDEGFIYGLGAAEVKLDFLSKLISIYKFSKNTNLEKISTLSPLLIGTFGEETGMQGALKIIRKNKINARYALISEPSDLQIINAAKGFVTVEIRIPFSSAELSFKQMHSELSEVSSQSKVFSGVATHSSTPHLGENAAVKLFEYLNVLPKDQIILDIHAGARFNIVPNQATVETVQASAEQSNLVKNSILTKLNKIYQGIKNIDADMKNYLDPDFIPQFSSYSIGVVRMYEDYVLVGGSCRIVPTVGSEVYEKWINMFQASCQEIGAEFHLQDYKKPFKIATDSTLVKAALSELGKLNIKKEIRTMASANEASLFSRLGIECLCIGVGEREGNIHTPTEKVSLKQIEIAILFYEKMMERFCC